MEETTLIFKEPAYWVSMDDGAASVDVSWVFMISEGEGILEMYDLFSDIWVTLFCCLCMYMRRGKICDRLELKM